jgi:hypothetical protein
MRDFKRVRSLWGKEKSYHFPIFKPGVEEVTKGYVSIGGLEGEIEALAVGARAV